MNGRGRQFWESFCPASTPFWKAGGTLIVELPLDEVLLALPSIRAYQTLAKELGGQLQVVYYTGLDRLASFHSKGFVVVCETGHGIQGIQTANFNTAGMGIIAFRAGDNKPACASGSIEDCAMWQIHAVHDSETLERLFRPFEHAFADGRLIMDCANLDEIRPLLLEQSTKRKKILKAQVVRDECDKIIAIESARIEKDGIRPDHIIAMSVGSGFSDAHVNQPHGPRIDELLGVSRDPEAEQHAQAQARRLLKEGNLLTKKDRNAIERDKEIRKRFLKEMRTKFPDLDTTNLDKPTTYARSTALARSHFCDWDGCSYSCAWASDLTRHKLTHTGEKPHVCDWDGCSYSPAKSVRY